MIGRVILKSGFKKKKKLEKGDKQAFYWIQKEVWEGGGGWWAQAFYWIQKERGKGN